ncbi:metallophosphoesterase [Actinophytocola sp.]|uniref:metallophosphoesterase family protein n=1 Tax=Actinophytocola sp. TaxID=1872138 RepID=UPI002EDB71C7
MTSSLYAVSDLHVSYPENRDVVSGLRAESPGDWLLVAGDVAERFASVEWALGTLREKFAKVIWVPGNHELWTPPDDPVTLRGVARYEALVEMARRLDVVTPEDPYPVWTGGAEPVTIAPLFLLYDYTFRPDGCATKAEGLAYAHQTGVVCTDEYLLHPDPYPTRDAWSRARVATTEARLAEITTPTVLVNHYPLVREPTRVLRYPEFAQWCGTEATADWHTRFNAAAMVYGHLHIPRTTVYDGIRFDEVSLGYPREWQPRKRPHGLPRRILPPDPTRTVT